VVTQDVKLGGERSGDNSVHTKCELAAVVEDGLEDGTLDPWRPIRPGLVAEEGRPAQSQRSARGPRQLDLVDSHVVDEAPVERGAVERDAVEAPPNQLEGEQARAKHIEDRVL